MTRYNSEDSASFSVPDNTTDGPYELLVTNTSGTTVASIIQINVSNPNGLDFTPTTYNPSTSEINIAIPIGLLPNGLTNDTYTVSIKNFSGISSTSELTLKPSPIPVTYPTLLDLNSLVYNTDQINVFTLAGTDGVVPGSYVLRVTNSSTDSEGVPLYTDTQITMSEGSVLPPGDNNLDVTPLDYNLQYDPIAGQYYFTIIPSTVAPGVYDLRIHNATGLGVGETSLTVTDAIEHPVAGGIIVSPTSYNLGQPTEVGIENFQALNTNYGYGIFNVIVPEGTPLGSYSVNVSNLTGTSSPQILQVTDPIPVLSDIILSSNTIDENTSDDITIGTLSTIYVGPTPTFTYTIVDDPKYPDNTLFNLVGNVLHTTNTFNYEDRSNYYIKIRSTPSMGVFYEKTIILNILDIPETPTGCWLTNFFFYENNTIGSIVGDIYATGDPDITTYTYELISGNDQFEIVNGNQLATLISFDADNSNDCSVWTNSLSWTPITIRTYESSSGGGFADMDLWIWIKNIGCRLDTTFVYENQPTGTHVGTLYQESWVNGDSLNPSYTFELTNYTDWFEIINGNEIVTKIPLNKESFPYYITNDTALLELTINVTVNNTYHDTQHNMAVYCQNIDEPFTDILLVTWSADSGEPPPGWWPLQENVPDGKMVAFVFASGDPDNGPNAGYVYELLHQPYNTFVFENNRVYINDNTLINSDITPYTETIRVKVTDPVLNVTIEKEFTLIFAQVAEAPTNISLSVTRIDEYEPIGTVIGSFNTTDQDIGDTFSYTLVTGVGDANNSSFSVSGSDLQSAEIFDANVKTSYSIRIRTTGSDGLWFEKIFTITIRSIPSTLSLSNNTVSEGYNNGDIIGTFAIVNSDIYYTYSLSLVDDADGRVKIEGMYLIVADENNIDYETHTSFNIIVRTTDQTNAHFDTPFTIQILNEDLLKSVIDTFTPIASKIGTQPAVIVTGRFFMEGGTPTITINGILVTPYVVTDTELRFVMPSLVVGIHSCVILNGNGL